MDVVDWNELLVEQPERPGHTCPLINNLAEQFDAGCDAVDTAAQKLGGIDPENLEGAVEIAHEVQTLVGRALDRLRRLYHLRWQGAVGNRDIPLEDIRTANTELRANGSYWFHAAKDLHTQLLDEQAKREAAEEQVARLEAKLATALNGAARAA